MPYGDIHRHVTTTTVAIRADGSRAVLSEDKVFHHYFIERDSASWWMFFDASRRLFVHSAVMHIPRYESRGWEVASLTHPRPVLPEAPDCPPPGDGFAKYAHETMGRRRLPDRTHLGFRVTVWRNFLGGEEWLAPRFHCEAVKTERIGERQWGVPRFYSRQELTAIRYGDPDPKLFDAQRPSP